MLVRIIVRILGGMWNVKERCIQCSSAAGKRIYKIIYEYYNESCGASIAWNAVFEGEPCFPHGIHGIFISGEARIGKNCVIFQNTTIGSNALVDSKGMGAPNIGSNCYIGAGAAIIGKVRIGNNVRIGANCVVYRDVAENCVVVSNVQRVIQSDSLLDNRFYQWRGKWVCYENGERREVVDSSVIDILNCVFKSHALQ
jgi:serine O-acetyltransferase